jgi:ADP-dependent NAD(P)H-hydrate dehydratase / NAD(P)H-hydrate epimerase
MDVVQLVTGAQMASIDRRAIEGGLLGIDLMESAGKGLIDVASHILGGLHRRSLAVLCGKGNNGGDGLVFARLATQKGAAVQVFLFASPTDLSGDAKANFERLPTGWVRVVSSGDGLPAVNRAMASADLVVDALLGTGISRPLSGLIGQAVDLLVQSSSPILAVDVPSGLDANTGRGQCAEAAHTVSFACPRIGHFFYPGRRACGNLHVVDIGIPDAVVRAEKSATFLIDAHWASRAFPVRQPDAHKGDCGRVFVLAGSVGLTGAATLSAISAVRSGAGLVTLGVPKSLNDILECKLTEAMTRPLPEVRKARCLALNARGQILALAASADACAIGPGLGRHRQTVELVRRLMRDLTCPTVLDADALNALAGHLDLIQACKAPLILTPHPGEFSRLSGLSPGEIRLDPIASAKKLAQTLGHILVLKGAPTIVAQPDGCVYVNPTGNPGMATGGTGDALTGLIAGLLAQRMTPSDAARLGVYVHGLAGDLVAKQNGLLGLTASDLALALPQALMAAQNGEHPNPYVTFMGRP